MEFPFGRELAGVLTDLLGVRLTRFLARFGAVVFLVWLVFFLCRTTFEGVKLFREGAFTETALADARHILNVHGTW